MAVHYKVMGPKECLPAGPLVIPLAAAGGGEGDGGKGGGEAGGVGGS